MGAVGLQTYIWNNNIRSTLLLLGFPVLLLGMVYALVLLMMGFGYLPSAYSSDDDFLIAGPAGFAERSFFDVGADRAAVAAAPEVKF